MTTGAKLAIVSLGVSLATWWYLPPTGPRVALPDLEAFFEPGVAHGEPTFVTSGNHVFYLVRLNEPVGWDFSWSYFQRLRLRGVQFQEHADSAHALVPTRKGWEIALAREKTVDPYTIEYWKGTDRKTASFPVGLRWPWLYVRLGMDITKPPTAAVLVPDHDARAVMSSLPRYPGAILRDIRSDDFVTLSFCAHATKNEILEFFEKTFEQFSSVAPERGDNYVAVNPDRTAAAAFGSPERISAEVNPILFSDDPLVVYSSAEAQRILPLDNKQQPAMLAHLPSASRYTLAFRYPTRSAAQRALNQLLRP